MYTIFSLEVLKKLAEVLNCSVNDLDEDIHFNTNEQEDNVINIPKEYTDRKIFIPFNSIFQVARILRITRLARLTKYPKCLDF